LGSGRRACDRGEARRRGGAIRTARGGERRTALARDRPLALPAGAGVEGSIIFTAMKVGCIKIPRRRRRRRRYTRVTGGGEIYRQGDDIGCCGAGTVAVGNRSDAIMCKARAFTIRARVCIYKYIYCGGSGSGSGSGGGGRIHYFASGTKSRDGKRSFILSLYSFYFLPT